MLNNSAFYILHKHYYKSSFSLSPTPPPLLTTKSHKTQGNFYLSRICRYLWIIQYTFYLGCWRKGIIQYSCRIFQISETSAKLSANPLNSYRRCARKYLFIVNIDIVLLHCFLGFFKHRRSMSVFGTLSCTCSCSTSTFVAVPCHAIVYIGTLSCTCSCSTSPFVAVPCLAIVYIAVSVIVSTLFLFSYFIQINIFAINLVSPPPPKKIREK